MSETPFDPNALDDVIHGRVRLAAMAYIAGSGEADFTSLKRALDTSDGNLSVHLRKLEEAGYLDVNKHFVGRRPQTTYQLTEAGRRAWTAYLERMRAMLEAAE
jgi:DNA-binding MarR family transcriptional regulator